MTDEEKAEEYANKNVPNGTFGYRSLGDVHYDVEQAYLAGLKAGRETERKYVKNNAFTSMKEQGLFPFGKWHKVADGDYPPYDKCNCSINVFANSGHIAYYNYDDECWIEVFSVIEINPPIAWCEIPKYTEE